MTGLGLAQEVYRLLSQCFAHPKVCRKNTEQNHHKNDRQGEVPPKTPYPVEDLNREYITGEQTKQGTDDCCGASQHPKLKPHLFTNFPQGASEDFLQIHLPALAA